MLRRLALAGLLICFAVAAPAAPRFPFVHHPRNWIITRSASLTAAPPRKVPGVVIDHSPASAKRYFGSPTIVILPDGNYLAAHDFYGPNTTSKTCATTAVFLSTNRGRSWHQRATVKCAFWSNLFVHHGAVYLMGATHKNGKIVIRRSRDDGKTWTHPDTTHTGLLTPQGHWHTAPVPIVQHDGRLWRAFENVDIHLPWGPHFRPCMLSVPANADLLVAANWTFSNVLPHSPGWLNHGFRGWLEGNAVVAPSGGMVDFLRVARWHLPEWAAIVHISADGRKASFNPATGFIKFRGGSTKFTIRKDPETGGYWTLANIATRYSSLAGGKSIFSIRPGGIRNTLALVYGRDLRHWKVRAIILHHPDASYHGFQYVDWQFDGKDIVAVARTAYDDGQGGPKSASNVNYMTFYRIKNFRKLKMASPGFGQPA